MAKVTDASLNLQTLWDNLFFQVVTQKDFYAKETIIQLMVAHHVCTSSIGTYKERSAAKVVLPKNLFVEYTSKESNILYKGISQTPQVEFASPILSNLEKQAIAQENIKLLSKLKMELENAQKVYNKDYELQYAKDYKVYLENIKPIIDEYNEEVETAKNEWCALQPTSSLPYDPNDPCKQPPSVAEPVIPEFNFTYTEELDDDFLSEQLTPESYQVYKNLNKPHTNIEEFDFNSSSRVAYISPITYDSFDSVYSGINQLIDEYGESK